MSCVSVEPQTEKVMVGRDDGGVLTLERTIDVDAFPLLVHSGTPGSRRLWEGNVTQATRAGFCLLSYDRPLGMARTPLDLVAPSLTRRPTWRRSQRQCGGDRANAHDSHSLAIDSKLVEQVVDALDRRRFCRREGLFCDLLRERDIA
jgi:hypothetical protein